MNGFARGAVLAACLGLAVVGGVFAGPPQKMIRIVKASYRLGISVRDHRCGLKVADVASWGPATRMVSLRNGGRGILEEGDIITHVNGKRVCGLCCLQKALARCNGTILVLTVTDWRTGYSHRWLVQPVRVWTQVCDD
jgi:S1-C subfamily serine protease